MEVLAVFCLLSLIQGVWLTLPYDLDDALAWWDDCGVDFGFDYEEYWDDDFENSTLDCLLGQVADMSEINAICPDQDNTQDNECLRNMALDVLDTCGISVDEKSLACLGY